MNSRACYAAVLLATLVVLSACQQTGRSAAPPPPGAAVRVGDTLYVAGQGAKSEQGIGEATRQTMRQLEATLKANGYELSDVVASSVWLTDLSLYSEMNATYASFFSDLYPTRTTLGIKALPGGASVQIAVVAAKGDKKAIYPAGAQPSGLPFTPGILVGDMLYLSGQAAVDPQTSRLIPGEDMAQHTSQTLKNFSSVLDAAGMDFSNVVSTWVFLRNGQQFKEFSAAYSPFFTEIPRPARIPVGAKEIPLGAPLEVTLLASRAEQSRLLLPDVGPAESYSRALQSGGTVYLAGLGSRDGSVAERVDHCLDRIEKLLAVGGMDLEDVVEARVYLHDISEYDDLTAAFAVRFPGAQPPALTVVGTTENVANYGMYMGLIAAKDR